VTIKLIRNVLPIVFALSCSCLASGPAQVVFRQDSDCSAITQYELAYEPVANAGTQPDAKATVVTVALPTGFACGKEFTTLVNVTGVGSTRFWLRADTADAATVSAWSNSIDANVPVAAPILVRIIFGN
jgi:hypothetical protein